MTPVMQTKMSMPEQGVHGNCFGACVASLLELPIDDMPAFEDMPDGAWFQPFLDLLKANGYTFQGTRHCRSRADFPCGEIGQGVDGLFIAGGESPRGFARGHCVIYDHQGNLIHDPHPDGGGLVKLWDVYMIERAEDTEGNDAG